MEVFVRIANVSDIAIYLTFFMDPTEMFLKVIFQKGIWTVSNFYDEAFLQKQLMAIDCRLFSLKGSNEDIWYSPNYTFERHFYLSVYRNAYTSSIRNFFFHNVFK